MDLQLNLIILTIFTNRAIFHTFSGTWIPRCSVGALRLRRRCVLLFSSGAFVGASSHISMVFADLCIARGVAAAWLGIHSMGPNSAPSRLRQNLSPWTHKGWHPALAQESAQHVEIHQFLERCLQGFLCLDGT